jgi:murein DD-endopeptidase MepM/ murein hydrolase activator NlpD
MEADVTGLTIGRVVDFDPEADRLYPFDFSSGNTELTPIILADTAVFTEWVEKKLSANGCRYGIGGYDEHRTIYARSEHFTEEEEPRRLHLGVDIWGPAGTPVYNFYDAEVHSFQFNNNFGDYGGTIILKYHIGGEILHALYGHLSVASLEGLSDGGYLPKGQQIGAFGIPEENGYWPPHLHFQLIKHMQGWKGDYPGVCQFSKKALYLNNCPDPRVILKHTFQRS